MKAKIANRTKRGKLMGDLQGFNREVYICQVICRQVDSLG
jgi:hypothetical protein